MELAGGINTRDLSLSTGVAVVALNLEPPAAGAGTSATDWAGAPAGAGGASGGAGAAARSSRATLPPLHPKFATNTVSMFEQAILSNNIDTLEAFIGNPHLIINKEDFNGLRLAAQRGLYISLRWCIENGIGRESIDKRDRTRQNTALMIACQPGAAGTDKTQKASCVALLLFAGATPTLQNEEGNTALHIAVKSKSKEIVELFCAFPPNLKYDLFSIKNKEGLTPLDEAKNLSATAPDISPEVEIDKLLSTHMQSLPPPAPTPTHTPVPVPLKESIESAIPLYKAIPSLVFGSNITCPDHRDLYKVKLRNKETGNSVKVSIGDYLASAARRGDIPLLTRFSGYLDCVDSEGRNVFMSACAARQLDTLKWLFENFNRATGKQLIDALNQPDDYGCTPTHFAASGGKLPKHGEAQCMELLMENGGEALSINTTDNAGFSPLHIASENLYPKIVTALVKRKDCDLNTPVGGLSPLGLAAKTRDARLKAATPEEAPAIDALFTEVENALLLRDVAPPSSSSVPAEKPPEERIVRLMADLALLRSSAHISPIFLEQLTAEITRLQDLMSAPEPAKGTSP